MKALYAVLLALVLGAGCGEKSSKPETKAKSPSTQKANNTQTKTEPTRANLKIPKKESKKAAKMPEGVTVEFVVKSAQSYVPKGNFIRLYSEESFMNEGVFVVQFPIKGAAEKLGVKNLVEHFVGKQIRVTGKVGRVIFSSTPETRPGIYLPDAGQVKIIKK